ncbi:MAG: hypothetical protein KDD94_01440 [Calditrichaeota bacterium]|nr:hypothetical protein [Calditrichota bacterium]
MLNQYIDTSESQARRQRTQYKQSRELFFDSCLESFVILNKEFYVTDVSDGFLKSMPFGRKEVIGKHISDISPGIKRSHRYRIYKDVLESGKSQVIDDVRSHPQFGRYVARIKVFKVGDGIGIAAYDITDLHNTIEQLKSTRELLKETNLQLKKKNELLEEFSYVASHDLQEPLQTIKTYSELFIEKYSAVIDQTAVKYLQFVMKSARHMSELVHGIREHANIGRHNLLQKLDVRQLVDHAIDNLHIESQDDYIRFDIGKLPVIHAYESEIYLLFYHLITNAIKFRKADQSLTIKISSRSMRDKWMFTVEDNGIGIPKKQQEKIFDLFRRLHSTDEYEGIGMGLANCQKIARLHGGEIWVESQLGFGSKFYVTIGKQ